MDLRIVATMLLYGQVCQNVMHFFNPDGALSLSAAADEFQNQWITNVKPRQIGNVQWTKIQVYNLSNPVLAPFEKSINILGTNSTTTLSRTFDCFVLKVQTAIAGRHGHGRIYLPGLHEGFLSNGLFQQSQVDAWATQLAIIKARFIGPPAAGPMTLAVREKAAPHTMTLATNILLRNIPGVQRRRNIGVGV